MKNYLVLIPMAMTLFISCETTTKKSEINIPKISSPSIDTSKIDRTLESLKNIKDGFVCDMEVSNSDENTVSQIFYYNDEELNPEIGLYHKFYSLNEDGKSAKANIKITDRNLWLVSYDQEAEDDLYTTEAITTRINFDDLEEEQEIVLLNSQAVVNYDSKINEFYMELNKDFMDQDGNVTTELAATVKINNCSESKIKLPLGL